MFYSSTISIDHIHLLQVLSNSLTHINATTMSPLSSNDFFCPWQCTGLELVQQKSITPSILAAGCTLHPTVQPSGSIKSDGTLHLRTPRGLVVVDKSTVARPRRASIDRRSDCDEEASAPSPRRRRSLSPTSI
jgi:hypothetical protein